MTRCCCRCYLIAYYRSLALLLLLLPNTSLARSFHGLTRFPWGCRGGSSTHYTSRQDKDRNNHFLSIGLVRCSDFMNGEGWETQTILPSWLTESKGSLIKCALLSPNKTSVLQFETISVPINKTAVVETLATTCDVIILIVSRGPSETLSTTGTISISPDVVHALTRGLQRRNGQGERVLRSTTVVVVVVPQQDGDKYDEELESQAWKDRISLYDMASVTPELVERLELVTSSELGSLWPELLQTNNRHAAASSSTTTTETDDLEEDIFPAVLQEAYRYLSGDTNAKVAIEHVILANETTVLSVVVKQKSTNTAILVQQVVWEAQQRLERIEARQEQIWLDDTASPMLEFGTMSEQILNDAKSQLASIDANNYSTNESSHYQVLMQLAVELRRLYQVQLQALREHYGRRYDMILESTRDERKWTAAASDATERFRIAAQHAIPTLCRQDGPLRDADFNYLPSLYGLISDMTQATALRQDLETSLTEDLDEENDEDGGNNGSPKRRSKWYHKLAARGLVLGVNYLQGWLAWKAIQKAADERDRNFPKFPLF